MADKLAHMKAMLTYLEATRFKLLNGLMDLEGRSRVAHPLASYLDHGKDKHGLAQTVLRIPTWVVLQHELASPGSSHSPLVLDTTSPADNNVDWAVRGTADGVAEHHWSPSPRTTPPSSGGTNHHRHSLLTAIDITPDGSSPVFTTTNPILYSTHAEALLLRGTADGGLVDGISGGVDDDDDDIAFNDAKKLVMYNSRDRGLDEEEDYRNVSSPPVPDSDFDEFDSNDDEVTTTARRRAEEEEEEDYSSGDRANTGNNSQDNEIHEIYYQVAPDY